VDAARSPGAELEAHFDAFVAHIALSATSRMPAAFPRARLQVGPPFPTHHRRAVSNRGATAVQHQQAARAANHPGEPAVRRQAVQRSGARAVRTHLHTHTSPLRASGGPDTLRGRYGPFATRPYSFVIVGSRTVMGPVGEATGVARSASQCDDASLCQRNAGCSVCGPLPARPHKADVWAVAGSTTCSLPSDRRS
jgi:hypothetical protein